MQLLGGLSRDIEFLGFIGANQKNHLLISEPRNIFPLFEIDIALTFHRREKNYKDP